MMAPSVEKSVYTQFRTDPAEVLYYELSPFSTAHTAFCTRESNPSLFKMRVI